MENLLITQFCKLKLLPLNGFKNSIFWGLHINNNLTWDTHKTISPKKIKLQVL